MKPASVLRSKTSVWIALLVLAVIIIIGLGLINKLSTIQRDRDIQSWQLRLSLMADVREDLLNNWLAEQYATLTSLAKNQSLQLYLSQISQHPEGTRTEIEAAQRTYLRNLLIKTAKNNGFYDDSPASPVKANIPTIKHSGIAIVNADGNVVITTPGMPLLDKPGMEKAKEVSASGNQGIRDIYIDKHSEPVIVFIVPVPALTSTNNTGKPTATIVGLRTIKNSLYPLLSKEIFSTKTDTSILVRQEQGAVVYLNRPNKNNTDMFMRLPRDPQNLAAAYALANPGGFGIRKDFSDTEVLFINRPIQGTDWLLLQTISAEEALRDSDANQRSLVTSFSLGLAALVFIIVASWRHGASLYAQQYANVLEEQSALLTRQRNLLESITDSIRDLIILVDSNLNIKFLNKSTASIYQLHPRDLVRKSLLATLGSENGKIIENHLQQTRDTGRIVVAVNELTFNDAVHTYHGSFLPVGEDTILIVLHDITALKDAQEKHERLLKHLVHTLTHVIDSYDPNCANHSATTIKIATAIGKAMNLPQADIETLELAACLANIGKLFVPREILTKTTELTPEERDTLQTTVNQTVEILVGLEFDGPVLETIAQKNEHMDGSGYPGRLSGENILTTARILAVANAFVAMHSPRAYRKPLSTDAILHRLYEDSGRLYDKHVVAALMHVAENELDWL